MLRSKRTACHLRHCAALRTPGTSPGALSRLWPGCQHDETHRRAMCSFHRTPQTFSDSETPPPPLGFASSEAGPVAQVDVQNCEEAQFGLKRLLGARMWQDRIG